MASQRKRAHNKKYSNNAKELKAKAKASYTPRKRRLPLKLATVLTLRKRRLPLKLAIVLTLKQRRLPLRHAISIVQRKRRQPHVPTQRESMPKTLQKRISPHKHTMQTTKKAGVLTEEPGMCWLSQSVMYKNGMSRKYSVIC